jgi:two-component sensor histidine kinase
LSGACETYALEQRYRRRDGGPIWVRVSAALARVKGDPSPNLVVIAIEDIDDRHKARQDLLDAKKDLERVVAERTTALSQRDVLLREVYHRVKNNLQIVDGLLMIESQKTTNDHAKAALTGIRERVFSLGLVHQQLMNSEDLKRFNVAPFLRELCRNLADGGPDHGVRVDCDSCDLQVDLDFAVPLGLIVTELVTNSIKHAFHVGGGVVSVSLRRDEGGDLVLIVSDDGQGPASAPPSHGRNGLGSSILRSLVVQLDGQMKVMCELGLTTEIRIERPGCS